MYSLIQFNVLKIPKTNDILVTPKSLNKEISFYQHINICSKSK